MSEDLSIQQKRPSAMPYMLGGAAVGTGVGLGVNHWTNFAKGTPMTHEDIIKEVNDTTAFSKRTAEGVEHAATWKEVGEKHAAWQAAEEGVKTAELGTPKDANLVAKMEKATKDKEKFIEDFVKNEKNVAKKAVTGKLHVVTPDEIQALGSAIKAEEAAEVNRLIADYNAALKNAKATVDRSAYNGFSNTVRGSFKQIDMAARADKGLLAYLGFDKRAKAVANEVKNLETQIAKLYPEIQLSETKRIAAEMKKAGLDYSKSSKKQVNKFLQGLNNNIAEQRKALLTEILGEKVQVPVIDKATGKVKETISSYANVERISQIEQKYIDSLARFDANPEVIKAGGRSSIKSVKHYQAQISKLDKKAADYATKLKDLQKLETLAKRLENIERTHTNGINKFVDGISYAKQQTTKINNAIEQAVAKQRGKLERFTNKEGRSALKELLFPVKEAAEINVEEATVRAKEAFSKTEAGKTLAQLEQKFASAAEREVNKEAVALAKERAATARGEFEKTAKSLGEKYLKGGKAKWIAPVVGAVALGVGAMMLRPKNNA